MKYTILLCILLNTALVTAQNTVQGLPTFLWSVTKQKFYGDKIEFNMSAKIPDGWMIFTERDTVVIPLEVVFSSTDSLLINKVLITQIKGTKGSNDKLRFVFGDNIEITKGDVEYIVTIFLKKRQKHIRLSGKITYYYLTEEVAMSPQEQAFILQY